MPPIKVIIVDLTGNKKTPVELPDDAPMKRLVPALATKMNLPMTNPAGQPVAYKLDHERGGKRLSDNDTLAGAGVQADDRLKLIPEVTAGDAIRLRRLRADYEKVRELTNSSEIISIARTEGDPPELYVIRFNCRSIVALNGGQPVYDQVHEVGIYLEAEYPRKKPQLKWMTPIFHPNIHANGSVCIGDANDNYGWWPGRPLDDLIYYLGQMAEYKMYNPASAYNGEAANWARHNEHLLPTDTRELRGATLDIKIGESTATGSSGSADDGLLGSIKISL